MPPTLTLTPPCYGPGGELFARTPRILNSEEVRGIENSERFALNPEGPRGAPRTDKAGHSPGFPMCCKPKSFSCLLFFFLVTPFPPFLSPPPCFGSRVAKAKSNKKKKKKRKKERNPRIHSDTHQWRQGESWKDVGEKQEAAGREQWEREAGRFPRKSPSGPTSPRRPRQGSEEPGEQMEEWSSL